MNRITNAKRIVCKVGTSTLTYENGKLNLRRLEELCKVLSDLQNSGREIVLVSSGAIAVGMGKLGMTRRPEEKEKRQALAAVGQCELMFMYDKLFEEYNNTVAQVLLTADNVYSEQSRENIENTFRELIGMGIIPVVNENDTVGTDELSGQHIGDNDTLSAIVATLAQADLLVIFTDIDALYDDNPKTNPNARRIPRVTEITDEIRALAGGAGTNRGTGGMATKVHAAEITMRENIPCCIIGGDTPAKLYDLLDGADMGTLFAAPGADE